MVKSIKSVNSIKWTENDKEALRAFCAGKQWPLRVITAGLSNPILMATLAKSDNKDRSAIAMYQQAKILGWPVGDEKDYKDFGYKTKQPSNANRIAKHVNKSRTKMVAKKVTQTVVLRFRSRNSSEDDLSEKPTGRDGQDNGKAPANNGKAPADSGKAPANNGKAPADSGKKGQDKGKAPADNGEGGSRTAGTRKRSMPEKLKPHAEGAQMLHRGPKQPKRMATPDDDQDMPVEEKTPRKAGEGWKKVGEKRRKVATDAPVFEPQPHVEGRRGDWSPVSDASGGSRCSTRSMKAMASDDDMSGCARKLSVGGAGGHARDDKESVEEDNDNDDENVLLQLAVHNSLMASGHVASGLAGSGLSPATSALIRTEDMLDMSGLSLGGSVHSIDVLREMEKITRVQRMAKSATPGKPAEAVRGQDDPDAMVDVEAVLATGEVMFKGRVHDVYAVETLTDWC